MMKPALSVAALAILSLSSRAQTTVDPQSALGTWRTNYGPSWTAETDTRTGFVRSLYGGHTPVDVRLREDRAAFTRARALVNATTALTGIDTNVLVEERAAFLPLSSAGSSDKYTVSFRQQVRGVPVVGASVHVLMDLNGRGLSIESSAVPNAQLASTTPTQEAGRALNEAALVFARIAGTLGTVSGDARLVLDPVYEQGVLRAQLAWEVDVFGDGANGIPRGLRVRLSDRDLSTTSREELVHTCDVTGTVFTRLTPGTLPDVATNPTVQVPLAHVQINSAQGNAITDINGNFNIVGASAPLNATVSYNGPFTTPTNAAVPVYSLPVNLGTPTGNSVVMNSPAAPFYTAEANSTYWLGKLRDYVRAVNPSDPLADIDALSHLNLAQTCNAYFDGSSVNFFAPGGGCPNTAYSTVIAHEMGHWLNVVYGSNNGPDGFGEGNADAWAIYLTDQPVVGDAFFGPGTMIRTGLNTKNFCGDLTPSCYGEVHSDGEVLMGALWKVRTRLKNTLGQSAGSATADLLFNGWMNAYNDQQIKSVVRTHWLVVDDDDGDIDNGSPHFADIVGGFVDQGFPNYVLKPVTITGVTQLPNTTNEIGPYAVVAHAKANINPPLQTPQLFWRSNGGGFTPITMTPQGGDLFQAAIPGQISPAKIEYYVRALDSIGGQGFAPGGAPVTLFRFLVGDERVFFSDTFDNSFTLWISGATSGVNDWQFNTPTGVGGDPPAPRTGTKCLGTDLGNQGFDGLYSNNSSNWIESPNINLSTCPRPILRLQRWLTVESAIHDTVRIKVNGQVVYANPSTGETTDTAWTEVEYDLTAIAAGNSHTKIRFELTTDGAVQRGGWNIDDVQILMDSAVGQGCVDPIEYCTAKVNSLGAVPRLRAQGAASIAMPTLTIDVLEVIPNKPGLLLRSLTGRNATPFSGGLLCIQPPVTRYAPFASDGFGYAAVPFTINGTMSGQTWYMQAWFRDPLASFGVGLSNGLEVKFCP